MTFSRDSKVIKWAYLFSEYGPPERTSLCALFWRTVLLTPLRLGGTLSMIGIVIYFASKLVWWLVIQPAWLHPRAALIFIACCAGGCAVGYAMSLWLGRIADRRATYPRAPSVIVEGLKAVKGKVCPLVEIR